METIRQKREAEQRQLQSLALTRYDEEYAGALTEVQNLSSRDIPFDQPERLSLYIDGLPREVFHAE